jgi:anti-anti-sigma factor
MAAQPTTEIEIHSPTACIVTLRGEHDAASNEAITLAVTLARSYTNVLVDLGSCSFVDSTVIGVLLAAAKRAHEQGGALELVVPVEMTPVRRTLEIANVQGRLPFHATREDGIACLAARRRGTSERGGVTVVRARIADDAPLRQVATEEERRAA